VTADSLTRSLTVINTSTDQVERTLPLAAAATDVSVDPTGAYLYVTLDSTRQFLKLNASDGSVAGSVPTGIGPGGIFWEGDGSYVGFCNRRDKTVTLVKATSFVGASGERLFYGQEVPQVCLAPDGIHMWALAANYGGDDPPPSFVSLIYRPSWGTVANMAISYNPLTMVQSPNGDYLYILERGIALQGGIKLGRDIRVITTDIN
jgi:hypothetical protein